MRTAPLLLLSALRGARAASLLARVAAAPPERCAAAPAEHGARPRAGALLHLRTCEAPAR